MNARRIRCNAFALFSCCDRLSSAMTIFLALSVAAFCPVPDFCRWSPVTSEPACEAIADADAEAPVALDHGAPTEGFNFANAWKHLRNISDQAPQSSTWQHGNTTILAIYGFGVAITTMRLFSGWLAVRALRRRSQPITDIGLRNDGGLFNFKFI